MKTIILAALLLKIASSAFAVSVEIEKYGSDSYAVMSATKNIVYLDKCRRNKLTPYEWRIWEGHYGVKATIQPIANIIVKRDTEDPYIIDHAPFIEKAIESSAKIGGNILCYVALKKWEQTVSYESMTFRAYRQFFLSGHKGLETYYNEKMSEGFPIRYQDLEAASRQPVAPAPASRPARERLPEEQKSGF